MAELKWIKLSTDLFNNRKIRMIESMPEGDAIVCIWMKILVLAGNVNDNGVIYFTPDIPYTDHMLATEFNRPLTTVQLALTTFQKFGMIDIVDDVIRVSNWEKYQSVDKMTEIREYNRLAQQKSRARKKELSEAVNDTCQDDVNDMSMTSQPCHETDKEEDKEEDIDIYNTAAVAINTPNVDIEIPDETQDVPDITAAATAPKRRLPYPPTLEMVQKYAEMKGLTAVNCNRFHNFWTDRNWLKKGQKFDWRITLAEWNEDDTKKQKQQQKALRDEYIQRDSAFEPVSFDERMAAQIDSLKDDLINDFPDLEAEDQFIDYLDPDMDMTG